MSMWKERNEGNMARWDMAVGKAAPRAYEAERRAFLLAQVERSYGGPRAGIGQTGGRRIG